MVDQDGRRRAFRGGSLNIDRDRALMCAGINRRKRATQSSVRRRSNCSRRRRHRDLRRGNGTDHCQQENGKREHDCLSQKPACIVVADLKSTNDFGACRFHGEGLH